MNRGLYGLDRSDPILLTGEAATCEVVAFNPDGLGLGSFGFPPEVHYHGYFLDHPQAVRAYRGTTAESTSWSPTTSMAGSTGIGCSDDAIVSRTTT